MTTPHMNTQPPAKDEPASEQSVNPGRRRLSKLALATPIISTFATRQALAANCLSNMLSGNLSDPDRGQCSKGWSPGGWGQPGGTVSIFTTEGAWVAAGFNYETSKITDVPGLLNKNSVPGDTLLNVVLRTELWPQNTNWQITRHLVCAYLNASLSENAPATFKYILTKDQVLGLASGTIPVPDNMGLNEFLDKTW